MSSSFIDPKENPLLNNLKDFPEGTQNLIISQANEKEKNAQRLGYIGKLFGEYPQVHYAMLLIMSLIIIIGVCIFKKIETIELKYIIDTMTPIITLLAGYIFGVKTSQ